jgi:hypothetical protein
MNERIEQLALQANQETGNQFDLNFEPLNEFLQKFAELIVRQGGYHADIFESLGCPIDMDPTDTKPSDYIKKHFGVEE